MTEAPQFSFLDSQDQARGNVLSFFADDTQTSMEDSAGAVARIRLYDAPLSAAQVHSLHSRGGRASCGAGCL